MSVPLANSVHAEISAAAAVVAAEIAIAASGENSAASAAEIEAVVSTIASLLRTPVFQAGVFFSMTAIVNRETETSCLPSL